MNKCNYFWNYLKIRVELLWTKTIPSLVLVAFVGMSASGHATMITINAIAPSQAELGVVGIPLSQATDFCIGSTGDGINGSGFGSAIVDDYSIIPGGSFASSHNISGGGLGLTDGGIGVSDWIPNSPMSNPEALCFDFPNDPVGPSQLFSVAVDANWLEDADVDESTILQLSGLDIFDCFFSYHDSDADIGNAISSTYYALGNCGVTLDPPSVFFNAAKEAQLVFDDENVRRFRVVSTPSMSLITLLFFGGLFMRPTYQRTKK